MSELFTIIGTKHTPHANVSHIGLLNATTNLSSTWVLNSKLNNDQLLLSYKDIDNYIKLYNLNMSNVDNYHLKINGTAENFSRALSIMIHNYQSNDKNLTYYASSVDFSLPLSLREQINNIIGLSNYPIASPHYVLPLNNNSLNNNSLNVNTPISALYHNNLPPTIAQLYNFPVASGSGQTIGIIELGGGFVLNDLQTYLSQLGISSPVNVVVV